MSDPCREGFRPQNPSQNLATPETYGKPARREPFEVSDLSPEDQAGRGWRLLVNGVLVTEVESAVLENERMGVTVRYGKRPEGFDGPIIHEPGGGGAVTIPFMINPVDRKIYIGLVREYRAAAGGYVYNVPRGFMDPGENHEQAAVRELAEETGLDIFSDTSRIIPLSQGLNPNTTFFDTSRETEDGKPEGAAIFGLFVEPEEVEAVITEDGATYYQFKQSIRDQAQGDGPTERIVGSMFVPIEVARRSADMYTRAAVGDLMLYMLGHNVLEVVGVQRPN